ncbi:MAG: PIN/TRAM domain-containing protein [Eubacterium sp.]
MIQKVLRVAFAIIGLISGLTVASVVITNGWFAKILPISFTPEIEVGAYIFFSIVFGLIFFIIFPLIVAGVKKLTQAVETSMESVRMIDIALAVGGLVIGLLIAMLISFAFYQIPFSGVGSLLTAVVYIVFGYLGFTLPVKKRDDILSAIQSGKKDRESTAGAKKIAKKKGTASAKVVDTSVVIDGRIYDICKAGFMEGTLIVPVFVLNELQLIADSSDDLKRNRGRRGLDIINKMQNDLDVPVQISEEDYDDLQEVDAKLVRMAKETKCKILTNDYNLNKVATVQGAEVLNINELANAVKPVVLPGEEMKVLLVKSGKESGQAVAYLDDGTMIVVENGRKYINENVTVIVTSILQTAAGRMIFAKPKK